MSTAATELTRFLTVTGQRLTNPAAQPTAKEPTVAW